MSDLKSDEGFFEWQTEFLKLYEKRENDYGLATYKLEKLIQGCNQEEVDRVFKACGELIAARKALYEATQKFKYVVG